MGKVKGPFFVTMIPRSGVEALSPAFSEFGFDKRFEGSLSGTSRGHMISNGIGEDQSGGYVALECVSGTLEGKTGAFLLQHNAFMDKGATSLDIRVVPGSGSGGLSGLRGELVITILEDGAHFYEFDYRFDVR